MTEVHMYPPASLFAAETYGLHSVNFRPLVGPLRAAQERVGRGG